MATTNKIFQAMASVMKDVEAIGKDQNNAQQGFKYRGIDDVYNALHGILAKNGIFTTPEVLEKTREERRTVKDAGTNRERENVLAFTCLRIKYTFWADDGSSVSCIVEGEGMDSGDKSSNKAMAVGHKYALLQTFCIPTAEEKDPDAECHEVAPRQQPTRQQAAPPATGTERIQINERIRHALHNLGCNTAEQAQAMTLQWTSFVKDGKTIPGKREYKELSDKAAEVLAGKLEKAYADKRAQPAEICADCNKPLSDGACVNPDCPAAPF